MKTTRKKFTPREYQGLIIEHSLVVPRCAVWAGMGMGKTVATLTTLDALELIEPGPTLVLAPKRVAQSTWPDEALKWEHLRNIEVCPVVGDVEQRKAALRKPANVFTINYEQLPWLVEYLGKKWPFQKIVADESTRLKSFRTRQGSSRARALGMVAHRYAKRFIELTGTPSPNGLQDLWGQLWFIDKGERLGRTYTGFKERWFVSVRVGDDPRAVKLVPMACAQEQIHDRLRDVCLSLDPKDYFDLNELVVNHVRVELPKKARALYMEMEKEMFMQIGPSEIEALNAASKTMKCLQLANGAIYIDDKKNFAEVHDVKIQALESIIEEAAGMPVLVAYHFESDLKRLQAAFPMGRALDENPRTISDWNAGRIPVLFAHPGSAGHGLNLQDGGNIIAVFGHWWNLEEFQQIIERIGPVRQLQAGYKRPVFIHHIIAADTIDEVVMARRESKRSVQDLLLEAMKRRKVNAKN